MLSRGALPAQTVIAVRETSETGNHIPVCDRVITVAIDLRANLFMAIFTQAVKQLDALFLNLQILAVLIGNVQKNAVNGGHAAINPMGNCLLHQCQRPAIAGECLGRAAVNVAGELIQQQHQGNQSVRMFSPVIQLATECRCHQFSITSLDVGVGFGS